MLRKSMIVLFTAAAIFLLSTESAGADETEWVGRYHLTDDSRTDLSIVFPR